MAEQTRTMQQIGGTAWYRRWAWASVAIVGALLALSGAAIIVNPVNVSSFESSTGIAWQADLATYVEGQARLCGSMALGMGLLTVGLAATLLRRGSSDAWRIGWFVPAVLVLMAAVFIASGATGAGAGYGVAAAIAGIGLWLARPEAASSV